MRYSHASNFLNLLNKSMANEMTIHVSQYHMKDILIRVSWIRQKIYVFMMILVSINLQPLRKSRVITYWMNFLCQTYHSHPLFRHVLSMLFQYGCIGVFISYCICGETSREQFCIHWYGNGDDMHRMRVHKYVSEYNRSDKLRRFSPYSFAQDTRQVFYMCNLYLTRRSGRCFALPSSQTCSR